MKIVLGLAVVGVLSNIILGGQRHSSRAADPNPKTEHNVDACYDHGYNVAAVFFKNLKSATESGVVASEMMSRACDDAVQKFATQDCRGQCEAGFKYNSKKWVNRTN